MFPSFLPFLELRFAARRLVRTPAFTTAAVFLLAIAIGGTTFVFSVVRGLLGQSIPYVDAERLVVLSPFAVEWDVLGDLGEQRGVFDRVAIYTERAANLTGHGRAERVLTGRVTLDYLPITGVRPSLGRLFDRYEFDAVNDPVVIITDRVWRRRYAHSRDVIGQTLTIDGRVHRIVGVLPPDFKTIAEMERVRDVPFNRDVSVFVPIMGNPRAPDPTSTDRISRTLTVLARVRDGVSIERVNAELAPILTRLRIRYPAIGPFTFRSLSSVVASTLPTQLAVLAAAVGILLVVACANVANLVLARVEGRRRELAVCRAIGSSTSRILGSVVAESLVIAVAGGMLGVLVAWQSIAVMKVLTGGVLEADAVRLDFQVLAFAAALILVTGVLVGLGPALRYAITDPGRILQLPASASGARIGVPFSSLLVVAQVALAVVLVVAGALLARVFERSVSVKPGFATEGVLTAEISLDRAGYSYWRGASTRYFADLLERLSSLSGVERAALVSTVPGGEFQGATGVKVEGRFHMAGAATVSPHYFEILSIPFLAGTTFTDRDTRSGPPVVVINAAFAREHWGTPWRALGQTIAMGQISTTQSTGISIRDLEWTVIGVVADSRDSAGGTSPQPKIYSTFTQFDTSTQMTILVRARSDDALALTQPLIQVVRQMDPDQPLYNVLTLSEIMRSRLARPRAMATVMNVFAAITLMVATLGVYAATSCMGALRRQEIGVRLALGGARVVVLRPLAWRGAKHVFVGIEVGILLAVTAVSILRAWLLGKEQADVPTAVVAIILVTGASLLALLVPAWRATRVDPIETLRAE